MIYKGKKRINHPKTNRCIGCGEPVDLNEFCFLLPLGYLCADCWEGVQP